MNIPIREKNQYERDIIQHDWLQFIKTGCIHKRVRYDKTGQITNYDKNITSIPFPHTKLLQSLTDSPLFEEARKSYMQNMNDDPTGKSKGK